jgi:hypothetical protein
MSDFAGLATWGLVAGVVAGVTLHATLAGERRTNVVRWCLGVGAIAVVFFGAVSLMGAGSSVPAKTVLGLGFVGFPAFVSGIVLLALGRLNEKAQSNVGETPDV